MATFDLIALDLDGTLLLPDDGISARSRAAIALALNAGVRVVLVTGRGVETPARIARELDLALPIICAHGAITKDFISNRVYGHIPVPLQFAKPMIEYAENNGVNIAVYSEEMFFRLTGHELYMDDMRGPHWREVHTFADVMHTAPTFIRFLGTDAVKVARDRFGQFPLAFKHETWGAFEELAVTSLDATKQHALAQLCRDFKIPPRRVLAIGDSRNDVPMLQWAGLGIAMANALPEVLAAIPTHTASNVDDGVALAVERYVLSETPEAEERAS